MREGRGGRVREGRVATGIQCHKVSRSRRRGGEGRGGGIGIRPVARSGNGGGSENKCFHMYQCALFGIVISGSRRVNVSLKLFMDLNYVHLIDSVLP